MESCCSIAIYWTIAFMAPISLPRIYLFHYLALVSKKELLSICLVYYMFFIPLIVILCYYLISITRKWKNSLPGHWIGLRPYYRRAVRGRIMKNAIQHVCEIHGIKPQETTSEMKAKITQNTHSTWSIYPKTEWWVYIDNALIVWWLTNSKIHSSCNTYLSFNFRHNTFNISIV